MRRAWTRALSVAGLALLLPPNVAAAPEAGVDPHEAVARIETASAAHPDDPDLLFALVRALAEVGDVEAAGERMATFVARWPERRPDADLEFGRLLFEAGHYERARAALARAVRKQPDSGPARLYLGLSFRQLGHRQRARVELERAAHLSHALEPEVLLVSALDYFEEGRDKDAVKLLRRILEIDPTGEAAKRVRLLLLERERMASTRWYRLDAYTGYEYDSNVSLGGGDTGPLGNADEADSRGVWGAGVTLRPLRRTRYRLTLGYRYDQTLQHALGDFDTLTNAGFASAGLLVTPRFALRLDSLGWNTRQDGRNYLTLGSLRPSLIYAFGPKWGTTRLFADFEWRRYDEKILTPAFERNSRAYGVGLEHDLTLPLEGSWGSLALRFERTLTSADSPAPFSGDYDHDLFEARMRLHVPLFEAIAAEGDLAFEYEPYANDNYLAFLSQNFALRKRSDRVLDGRLALSRPLWRQLRFELAWLVTHRDSNVRVFDYDRHVLGVYLRASSE